jgi:hypothetical protein
MDGDVTKPLFKSEGAYVAGGVLVAAIPSVPITISGGHETITIKLTAGVLTGTLQQGGPNWFIDDGILAARWFEDDIFAALSSYRNNSGSPVCTDSIIGYPQAKGLVCQHLDILKDSSGPKSLPCDSLSIGIGFKAFPTTSKGYLWSEVAFLVSTEVGESKLKDVGRAAIFVFEAMERLRSDIAGHTKNGSVGGHGQEVLKGKTT